MIPQDTVNQILQAAEISEVVGEFVNLKKKGASMMACCPFHNEKTPSFSVSPTKGIYKCFGCGKAGDSVRFIMDLEGYSYPEALKWLAKKYNIEVKEKEFTNEELASQNEKDSLYIVTEFAEQHFHDLLLNHDEGKSIGLSYFRERGISQPMIERFSLGYALDTKDTFYKKALTAGFSEIVLDKAGLISKKDDHTVLDRFRGRVVFPIYNLGGKAIAFGARILKKDAKAPKYINSPETEIYHKSHILYGISQAKNSIRQHDNCFLVEGYLDVISLHQGGIENVVASSGTSLTTEQVRLMGRFTQNITVLYDGDPAGIKAAIRSVDIILEEGLNLKVVVFPNGDDPDSYIRKVGGEAFLKYIEVNRKDFIRFKTEIALEEIGDDPVKKADLIENLVSTIVKIPNPVKRQVFYQEVAKVLEIDEQVLINEGNRHVVSNIKLAKKEDGGKFSPSLPQRNQELEIVDNANFDDEEPLVRDLVLYGSTITNEGVEGEDPVILADFIFSETDTSLIKNKLIKAIYQEYYSFYERNETPSERFFASHTNPEIQSIVISWMTSKHNLSPQWVKFEIFVDDYRDILGEMVSKLVFRVHLIKTKNDLSLLLSKLQETEDEDEQDILINAIEEKNEEKKMIAQELGAVL